MPPSSLSANEKTLADAWARWRTFARGDVGAEPSRGIALLQTALHWDRPSAGPRRPTETALACGEQWRLVMGYSGFAMVAKSLLDTSPRSELRREDFASLIASCTLPACEPVNPPGSQVDWCGESSHLDPQVAQAITDWLVRRVPVSDWCSLLCLARALCEATTSGHVSANDIQKWQLRPVFTRLLADLALVAASAIAALTDKKRRPVASTSSLRPVPVRIAGLEPGGEEEALVRTIASIPEDDSPRLVYADWLEEHGHTEQAEFTSQPSLRLLPGLAWLVSNGSTWWATNSAPACVCSLNHLTWAN